MKSIKVIEFNDKENEYRMWARKFMSVATTRGYRDVLLGKTIVPPQDETLDENVPNDKIKLKGRNANDKAYNNLILACSGEIGFSIVDEAVTEELPDGDAELAWKELQRRFEPDTSADKVKLKKEFSTSKLTSWSKDPETWISKLEVIRKRLKKMGNEISDEDMMIHIMNNLPQEYDTVVEAMERKLDDLVDPLTLRNLKNELLLKYNRIKKNKGMKEESENEEADEDTALVGYTKNFKGRCYNCGEFGHKKEDCPKLKNQANNSNTGRISGTCFYCGKRGHKRSDCRKLKKRLEEIKNETLNLHQEKEDKDVVLMSHEEEVQTCKVISEYSDNEKEIKDKEDKVLFVNQTQAEAKINDNLWIADSGASCHMTNSLDGMKDLKEDYAKIKIGSGKTMLATKRGTYEGMVISKDNKKTMIQLRNVRYVPEMFCKLISLTKAMKNGYDVIGKNNIITLQSGKQKISFDRVIQSGKGILLGMMTETLKKNENQAKYTEKEFHDMLGHPNNHACHMTARN